MRRMCEASSPARAGARTHAKVGTKSHAFATPGVRPCRSEHGPEGRSTPEGRSACLRLLALQRADVAAEVDLAADQHVAPRALAVLCRVVLELVPRVAESGQAGEVRAKPVVRPAALSLRIVTRAR